MLSSSSSNLPSTFDPASPASSDSIDSRRAKRQRPRESGSSLTNTEEVNQLFFDGICLLHGYGVQRDLKQGIAKLEQAYKHNHPHA